MTLDKNILEYIKSCETEAIELLETLSAIPAPSGKEEKRAEFCKQWLQQNGCKDVYIDSALNVIYPVNCDSRDDIVLFTAHTDTVFPDTDPLPIHNDGIYVHAPGVGDDTACVVLLLLVARYVAQNNIASKRGIIFAANSCEEGLGNLKGIKQLMTNFEGRITNHFSFDLSYTSYVNKCVGSHRYRVTISTEGGHSFSDFGKRNAIQAASELICRLYDCKVPICADSKTTFNVGEISGGTSVNTIAQSASFLYEFRSDYAECLAQMARFFEKTIANFQSDEVRVTTEILGIRPCAAQVDAKEFEDMCRRVSTICEKHSGRPCPARKASTDCNIPMSLGIPAVAVGGYIGSGTHTRQEKLLISSLPVGLKIAMELILSYF